MTASGEFDTRPVRAFLPGPDLQVDESAWPASVPAMAQVLRQGLELPAGLTVLVGENGSGKSTVVETLAEAYGLKRRPATLVVFPARRHDAPAVHLPGAEPGQVS
jgi:hypothetical protein